MSKKDKLIQKILDEKDITYQECEKVLISLGYKIRTPRSGGSHVSFTKDDDERAITLVKTQNPVKKYLIKQVKEAIQND